MYRDKGLKTLLIINKDIFLYIKYKKSIEKLNLQPFKN